MEGSGTLLLYEIRTGFPSDFVVSCQVSGHTESPFADLYYFGYFVMVTWKFLIFLLDSVLDSLSQSFHHYTCKICYWKLLM